MKLMYIANNIAIYLGSILTNHCMTTDEALNFLGVDMDQVAHAQGWDDWDPEALQCMSDTVQTAYKCDDFGNIYGSYAYEILSVNQLSIGDTINIGAAFYPHKVLDIQPVRSGKGLKLLLDNGRKPPEWVYYRFTQHLKMLYLE